MPAITDADRRAAQELRVILADICGFWHQLGDDSPLCLALAKHRQDAETSLMDKLVPLFPAATSDQVSAQTVRLRPAALPCAAEVKLSA